MDYTFAQLEAEDSEQLEELNVVFADAFKDPESYLHNMPSDGYLRLFLETDAHIVLVAQLKGFVVGGLVAYELKKFEQERSEIYIYDLAVAAPHRRKGIATELLNLLKQVAKERDAFVIYVQANKGDEAAIKLYEALGTKEDVLHFDIEVDT